MKNALTNDKTFKAYLKRHGIVIGIARDGDSRVPGYAACLFRPACPKIIETLDPQGNVAHEWTQICSDSKMTQKSACTSFRQWLKAHEICGLRCDGNFFPFTTNQ